jgi:phage terminase large subunit-like protein
VSYGSTYDNAANLPPKTLARLKKKYENTTLGQQELLGRILEASEGALWNPEIIQHVSSVPTLLQRVVIGVDPAGSHKPTSDETGIVAAGLGEDGKCYVLADKTGRYSPEQWATEVESLYDELEADAVIAEANFGGELVRSNLRSNNRNMNIRMVHAVKGKVLRAEPVVGVYERRLVSHVGVLAELETQQTTWIPPGRFDSEGAPIKESKESPDHIDAAVYVISDLLGLGAKKRSRTVMRCT